MKNKFYGSGVSKGNIDVYESKNTELEECFKFLSVESISKERIEYILSESKKLLKDIEEWGPIDFKDKIEIESKFYYLEKRLEEVSEYSFQTNLFIILVKELQEIDKIMIKYL